MAAIAVPIQRIDKTLDMPAYAYPGDAGLDLHAAEAAVLKPFERKLVSCGIKMAIPRGYAGFVMPRSGLAVKHGISIVNSPGLIDSDYRGEIKAILVNLDLAVESAYMAVIRFCIELRIQNIVINKTHDIFHRL